MLKATLSKHSVWAMALTLISFSAWANEAAPEGAHDNPSVPDYILHHVADSSEYELELPGPLFTGHNPTIHLNEVFSALKFEVSPGACASEHPSFLHGCIDLIPTKHVLMMWLASAILLLVMLTATNRDSKQLVTKGTWKNIFEMLVLFVRDEIAVKNIGKADAGKYLKFLLSIFFFILFINLLGLVPFMATATGNLGVTAGLAICAFIVTQVAGIRAAGVGGYLAHLTGGVHPLLWLIMIPVEVLGLFTKPFALTMRLFANMLAGHIVLYFILGLIFMLHVSLAVVSVPMAAAIYLLEMFVAFVQAYVFTMLTAVFIGMNVAMAHHDHDEHGEEAAH